MTYPDVIDLDALRTEWHERAVVSAARARGEDPDAALAVSRRLRAWASRDLRLPIQKAMAWAAKGSRP